MSDVTSLSNYCGLVKRLADGIALPCSPVLVKPGISGCELPASKSNAFSSFWFCRVKMNGAKALSKTVWWRIAGISGCSAVALGAYGEHRLHHLEESSKSTFRTAQRVRRVSHPCVSGLHCSRSVSLRQYHLLHSVVLLAVPLARRPALVGTLLTTGMAGFCGSLYYTGASEDRSVVRMAPVGGSLLMAAWLALLA